MSDTSTEVSSHVQAIQDAVQNTCGGSDSDVSGASTSSEEGTVKSKKQSNESTPTAVCSGDGGCGETFPSDTPGCDFLYAMLCSDCYKKVSKSTAETEDKEGGSKEDEGGNKSDDEVQFLGDDASGLVLAKDEPESSSDESEKEKTIEAGKEMGLVLQNVRDIDSTGRYDVEAGGNTNVYVAYVNDQDNVSKKCKKFWHLLPNPSYILYGFLNYHALLNTSSHRAWLAHCRLSTKQPGADGNGYVLWEVWETRCNKPRIDGILIKENGDVVHLQKIETWLKKNGLSSDMKAEFDEDFYKR